MTFPINMDEVIATAQRDRIAQMEADDAAKASAPAATGVVSQTSDPAEIADTFRSDQVQHDIECLLKGSLVVDQDATIIMHVGKKPDGHGHHAKGKRDHLEAFRQVHGAQQHCDRHDADTVEQDPEPKFEFTDDGRIHIWFGDELVELGNKAARRLQRFLGRIDIPVLEP